MPASKSKRGALGSLAVALGVVAAGLVTAPAHADAPNTCADTSSQNGQIAGCMIATRADEWISANPTYSMSVGSAGFGEFRADCSGFVSFALHLSDTSPTLGGLVTGQMYESNGFVDVAKDNLQQGDILDNPAAGGDGHVVLFDHWTDSSHTAYWGFENTGSGNSGYHTIPYPYWSGAGTFYPQHYTKLVSHGGGVEEAFQANSGFMYTRTDAGSLVNTQEGMMAGTNPAVASLADGSSVEAFQANTGFLYTRTDSGALVNTQEGLMAGTSPAIAALPGGGYVLAFQGNDGYLYTLTSSGVLVNTQEGMMAGTSPAIAASPGGGFEAAFQANTGFLYTRTNTGALVNTQEGMLAGTSPAITAR